MFTNIDKKIKTLAIVSTVAGCILSFIAAICCWVIGEEFILLGFVILIAGGLVSWIGSFLLYGFGELITQTTRIANGNAVPQKVENGTHLKKSVNEPKNDVKQTTENVIKDNDTYDEVQNVIQDDIAAEDERNIAQQDECPCCFSRISPDDKECSFCGLKLK